MRDITSKIELQDSYKNAKHIAIYLTNDGEIGTRDFIELAWSDRKYIYLPVIHPFSKHHLLFVRYQPETVLVKNRFGIPEPIPTPSSLCLMEQLDIVFTPLVAFDKTGARMGMGGGFYDRTLASLQSTNPDCQIIGLAHDCQEVEHIDQQPWDIPLHQIITPSRHIIITTAT